MIGVVASIARPRGASARIAWALAAALVCTLPAPAQDESADTGVREAETEDQAASDVAFLNQCLETIAARGAPARVCIDIVARGCASEAGGDTTAGAVACIERERNAWQTLMTEASAALEQAMSNTERERFVAAQDAWSAFRDAECAYEAAMFEDGALAGVERTSCERRLIAERTIAIHERAAYIAERIGDN